MLINEVFGIPIEYDCWNKRELLPLYISGSYSFKIAYVNNIRCIMVTPIEELDTLPVIKKQLEQIKKVDDAPIILNLQSLSSYRRKSFIEHRIAFITQRQIFLPFLGTLLTNEKDDVEKKLEKFMFSTQQLLLAYLYINKKKIQLSEIAKILPFSAMTLTRAVKQLEMTDLFIFSKEGANKVIESKYSRIELFNRIREYLSTPVRKVTYIGKTEVTENMVIAGENVLAEKSMLNTPRLTTYAVNAKGYCKNEPVRELVDPGKQVKLEIWRYNPNLFSDGVMADGISVALSFQDNTDERIEEAVDILIEKELGQQWLMD